MIQHIYIYIDCHFFLQKKTIFSNLQKAPVGVRVTPRTKFILASPITNVTSKTIIFGVDIDPILRHGFSDLLLTHLLCHRKNTNYLLVAAEGPV